MRRRRQEPARPPDELWQFDEEAWRARGGYEAWRAARRAWEAEHGWPGDPLEMLKQEVAVKRRLSGAPERNGRWGRQR